MNVPSKRYTLTYFSTLGYSIEHDASGIKGWRWKLKGEGLPLDGGTFATRLGLWAEWMGYAARRIHEDIMTTALIKIWEEADDIGKSDFAAELRRWADGSPSPRLQHLLRASPGGNTDRLPRNWKLRMRKILANDSSYRPLWIHIRLMTGGSDPRRR